MCSQIATKISHILRNKGVVSNIELVTIMVYHCQNIIQRNADGEFGHVKTAKRKSMTAVDLTSNRPQFKLMINVSGVIHFTCLVAWTCCLK